MCACVGMCTSVCVQVVGKGNLHVPGGVLLAAGPKSNHRGSVA